MIFMWMDAFMNISLGIEVDEKRGEWVLKLNKSLYETKQTSENWFYITKTNIERRGYH